MKQTKHLLWLAAFMAILLCPRQARANDMLSSSHYHAELVGNNRIRITALVADLKGHDSWMDAGRVVAYEKPNKEGTKYSLMTMWNSNQDEHDAFPVIMLTKREGSSAIVHNVYRDRDSLVVYGTSKTYYVNASNNHQKPYAVVDYYWDPGLSEKTLYLYMELDIEGHDDGSHTYELTKNGPIYLPKRLNQESLDREDYSFSRPNAKQIAFTMPPRVKGIADHPKLKDYYQFDNSYEVKLEYTLNDGTKKTETKTFDCGSNDSTVYINISSDKGNFQKVKATVKVTDGLKNKKTSTYYYKDTYSYTHDAVVPAVPKPTSVAVEYNQFSKKNRLIWSLPSTGNYYKQDLRYIIYRLETKENGNAQSGASWTKIAIGTPKSGETSYEDGGIGVNKYYKYRVFIVPKAWLDSNETKVVFSGTASDYSSLSDAPSSAMITYLGYVETDNMSTAPQVKIKDFQQDETVKTSIQLKWQYSRVPVNGSAQFQVWRKAPNGNWENIGSAYGDADPSVSYWATFNDETASSQSVTYNYEIRLPLNNGDNIIKSNTIYASLLAGTEVTEFDATKGTYENSVLLQWSAEQSGTAATTYDLFHRQVDSDDWAAIGSVSGTGSTYSFEDRNVSAGLYYEYKVEAYQGQRSATDVKIYSKKSYGFSQSSGVVSGSITYNNSSAAVEGVRVTLTSNDEIESNAAQSYSKRVDGASTGITWRADTTSMVKVFGNDKDYTVQMFVRPDADLSVGSVIANVPNYGKLYVGAINDDGSYQLYSSTTQRECVTETFTKATGIRGIAERRYEDQPSVYTSDGVSVKTQSERKAFTSNWDSGWSYQKMWSWTWGGIETNTYVYRKLWDLPSPVTVTFNKCTCISYDLNISLQPDIYSLLSLASSQGQTAVSVNDSTSISATKKSEVVGASLVSGLPQDYVIYKGHLVWFYDHNVPPLETTGDYSWMWRDCLLDTGEEIDEDITMSNDDETNDDEVLPSPYFSLGGSEGLLNANAFHGYFSDVRVWNHLLTDKEKTNYNDRVLSGREAGLMLYWPMDEGIDKLVFDVSYTNDVPNGRHATLGTNITSKQVIPSYEQLSRYGVTNANGEYTIRGIPFIGSGTTYTFTPSKGIHTFTPTSRNGFISASSLALNNYDFTDNSAFTVKGTVTYQNTNIPVDSVQFKIDDNYASTSEGVVTTDVNGEYTISVPIGEHRIEAYRNGHRLTAFPLKEGETYNFMQDEVVNFTDSTLVNVTGRINGGYKDENEPLGFRRSTNRIGQAVLKLSLDRDVQSSFNYLTDERGNKTFGTTPISVESATDSIRSTAYRGAGTATDNSNTKFIYIATDPATGEFSAMLPPLRYKVESITFPNDEKGDGAMYNNLSLFTQNLPVINATATDENSLKCDSLTYNADDETASNTQYYYYTAKFMRQLRNEPHITVTQKDMKYGAFGAEKVTALNPIIRDETEVTVVTYDDNAKSFSYDYGYPLFCQNKMYSMMIGVSETYTNVDTKAVFAEVPRDAVITVENEGSCSTAVVAEEVDYEGEHLVPGDVYEVSRFTCVPDATGTVGYHWTAGFPNVNDNFVRHLTISAEVNGRETMWKAPGSQSGALDMVVLGGLSTGTNFVTEGPDCIDMVIRRPPGSTSYATWATDSVVSYNYMSSKNWGYTDSGGIIAEVGVVMSISTNTPTSSVSTEIGVGVRNDHREDEVWDNNYSTGNGHSYSVAEALSTPAYDTYTQNNGDTYIGCKTNLLFGKGKAVNLFKQTDGSYKLDCQETICTGETFGTTFVYPQQYIEDVLIPNWLMLRDNYLTHVTDTTTATNIPTVDGRVMFYTPLNKGDKDWGKVGTYKIVNGLGANAQYADSVQLCNTHINNWRNQMAENERDKLNVFGDAKYLDKNYSIAGGTSVSQTITTTVSEEEQQDSSHSYTKNNDFRVGFYASGVRAEYQHQWNKTSGTKTAEGKETSKSNTFTWVMSDAEPSTALSVDVFKSKLGWGPVFRTRGGQSSNPYEGATYTKYHNPGVQLDMATMRVENPDLRVDGATTLTNIPSGTAAKFNLKLVNASETNNVCTYKLECVDGTNPKGAVLTIDGYELSSGHEGRTFRMEGGQTIDKVLYLSQPAGDRSVMDFEDIKLVLRSLNDTSTISRPVAISVHFIPASATIDMAVNRTVLNRSDYENDGGFLVTMTNLNRQDEGLKGVRVQYRRKGMNNWSLAKEWQIKKDEDDVLLPDVEELPEGAQFSTAVTFAEDGIYELRTQTFGMYGYEEVTYATDIVEVTQDLRGPKVLGSPYPQGTSDYVDRDNIHLTFNEAFNTNALSKSDNFIIEGNLNNAIFGKNQVNNPDVALQLESNGVKTQSAYQLAGTDLAVETWIYRQGDGNIVRIGTESQGLAFGTTDDGKAQLTVGSEVYTSDVSIPEGKWVYLAMTYNRNGLTDSHATVNAIYADDAHDRPVVLFENKTTEMLDGQGKLAVGGNGMVGRMRDLALWNVAKDIDQLYVSREELKAAYVPGLLGYWRMDEGHGLTLVDKARSRNMEMTDESWYINNRNLSAHLEANDSLAVDIRTFAPRNTDNFAIEMWFRGEQAKNGNASLLNIPQNISVGFEDGKLAINTYDIVKTGGVEEVKPKSHEVLSNTDYSDNSWHHFALNVRRGMSAIAYVDGKAVKTMPESNIPVPAGSIMYVGQKFCGDVDELRIWNASLMGNSIDQHRYERLDNSYAGLVAYFPFEDIHRTQTGTVITEFKTDNFGTAGELFSIKNSELPAQGITAPALLPGSQRMRLDATEFDFTASDKEIYLSFPDDMLPRMDGNDITITVKNVKDEHGNVSEPVEWTFRCNWSALRLTLDNDRVRKNFDETITVEATVASASNAAEDYELVNLPWWLKTGDTIGTTDTEGTTLAFTIPANIPVGHYQDYIYVKDKQGIVRSSNLSLVVTGDEPDWSFDAGQYMSNMTLTGQIYVGNRMLVYEDSKIGAFNAAGQCVGVARPVYVPTRDAYYVNLVIYGETNDNSNNNCGFQLYDSSTGITCPLVLYQMPGDDTALKDSLTFRSNDILGSYDSPVNFIATDAIKQQRPLDKGWNWVSLYVKGMDSDSLHANYVFKPDVIKMMYEVKGHTAGDKPKFNDQTMSYELLGMLDSLAAGQMYKVRMKDDYYFSVIGKPVDVEETKQTIRSGWNWIGPLTSYVMPPDVAFADLNPQKGDMVKSRTSFAQYNGFVWEGMLQEIAPACGYLYLSKAGESKDFHYPKVTLPAIQAVSRKAAADDERHWTVDDINRFPDNMTVLANLTAPDGMEIDDAEMAAFIDGECRGTVRCKGGYYFLTVMGISAEDTYKPLTLKAWYQQQEYSVAGAKMTFVSDASYGSFDEGVVELSLMLSSGINSITVGSEGQDNWFDLSGRKLQDEPAKKGVYIKNGEKKVVK